MCSDETLKTEANRINHYFLMKTEVRFTRNLELSHGKQGSPLLMMEPLDRPKSVLEGGHTCYPRVDREKADRGFQRQTGVQ